MEAVDIGELVRQTLMVLTVIIVAAKLGGELMGRLGQPPVLGELLMGVVLGNLSLFGITLLDPLKNNSLLRVLAEIGAILLLFEVGVESDLIQLLAVGWSSLVVATLGVIAPMMLGYFVATQLIPDAGWLTHLFVGGTLTATSVGITARVLKDLGKANTKEARIILGAAVADDVIGLVVLAVVSGLTTAAVSGSGAGSVSWMATLWIVVKASLFLILAVVVGRFWSQRIFAYAARLQVSGALLALCICFCFVACDACRTRGPGSDRGSVCSGRCPRRGSLSALPRTRRTQGAGPLVSADHAGGPGVFRPDGTPRGSAQFLFHGGPDFRRTHHRWWRSSENRSAGWAFSSAAWTASRSGLE